MQVFHFSQKSTQNPEALKISFVKQHIFATCTRTTDINSGVDAFLSDLAIQVKFLVTRTFKFLEDNLVHLRTSINQCGCDDGQRATFFDVTRSTKEALWLLKSIRVNTTGQNFT